MAVVVSRPRKATGADSFVARRIVSVASGEQAPRRETGPRAQRPNRSDDLGIARQVGRSRLPCGTQSIATVL